MLVGDVNNNPGNMPVKRGALPQPDPVQRDVYEKTADPRGGNPLIEPGMNASPPVDGSTINTSWGYGKNENAFNVGILNAVREKWGDYVPSIPPIIVKSTVAQESSFDPKVVSHSGYVGLMQLGKNEALAHGLSLEPIDERYIPDKNLMAGVGTLKTKHKVVTDPLSTYGNEEFGKNVAAYYKEKSAPTELQSWFLGLAAFNGGGGTVLRAMNYAIAENKDPLNWNTLLEPKEALKKSPLYRAVVDIYGDTYAERKYYEMGRYPVGILKRAGFISASEAEKLNPTPPDYESGDDTPIAEVNKKELIQQIKNNELKSDAGLDDPLPAVTRPGTNKVVDESRDSSGPIPEGGERTFGHKRVKGELFDKSGNWLDIGTAVAADQLKALSEKQVAEFAKITGAKPEEITPGDSSIMLLSSTENWDQMVAPKPAITYKEIDFSKIGKVTIEPKYIVMHYTGGVKDSANGVWNWFNEKKGKPSTQFIVSNKGDILQTMPEKQMCSGTLDFNKEALNIEVCGNFREQKETDEEFNAAVALVKYLQKEYKIPDANIISHRQVDNNFGHVGRKSDPGFRFMNRLYDALR